MKDKEREQKTVWDLLLKPHCGGRYVCMYAYGDDGQATQGAELHQLGVDSPCPSRIYYNISQKINSAARDEHKSILKAKSE